MSTRSVWAGQAFPLGPEWDGDGTNFSLFSENAERVELCLFDPDGPRSESSCAERTAFNWHVLPPGRRAGTATTATECTARTTLSAACASIRPSC